jgi:hypothetical protein
LVLFKEFKAGDMAATKIIPAAVPTVANMSSRGKENVLMQVS